MAAAKTVVGSLDKSIVDLSLPSLPSLDVALSDSFAQKADQIVRAYNEAFLVASTSLQYMKDEGKVSEAKIYRLRINHSRETALLSFAGLLSQERMLGLEDYTVLVQVLLEDFALTEMPNGMQFKCVNAFLQSSLPIPASFDEAERGLALLLSTLTRSSPSFPFPFYAIAAALYTEGLNPASRLLSNQLLVFARTMQDVLSKGHWEVEEEEEEEERNGEEKEKEKKTALPLSLVAESVTLALSRSVLHYCTVPLALQSPFVRVSFAAILTACVETAPRNEHCIFHLCSLLKVPQLPPALDANLQCDVLARVQQLMLDGTCTSIGVAWLADALQSTSWVNIMLLQPALLANMLWLCAGLLSPLQPLSERGALPPHAVSFRWSILRLTSSILLTPLLRIPSVTENQLPGILTMACGTLESIQTLRELIASSLQHYGSVVGLSEDEVDVFVDREMSIEVLEPLALRWASDAVGKHSQSQQQSVHENK